MDAKKVSLYRTNFERMCRFIAQKKFWSKFVSLHCEKKMLKSKFVSLHRRIRWIRDSLIALSVRRKLFWGFFIASSREKILVRKNCIALFDLFLGRLCVGVALIDTFSSIAAHHWLLVHPPWHSFLLSPFIHFTNWGLDIFIFRV